MNSLDYKNIIETIESQDNIYDIQKVNDDLIVIPESESFNDNEMIKIANIVSNNSKTSDVGFIRNDIDEYNDKTALYILFRPDGIIGYIEYYGRQLEMSDEFIKRAVSLSEKLNLETKKDACVSLYAISLSSEEDLDISDISNVSDVDSKEILKTMEKINNAI